MQDLGNSGLRKTFDWLNQIQGLNIKIVEAQRFSRFQHQSGVLDWHRELSGLLSVKKTIDAIGQSRLGSIGLDLKLPSWPLKEHERLLRIAIQPFPNLSVFSQSPIEQRYLGALNRLNLGISESVLLAEFEIEDKELDNESMPSEVESQLIEIVPAEALAALKQVRFVPFSLLDMVVARPEVLFEIPPRTFEEFVAELVSQLGIDDVILTPERADGGRDVIGTKRLLGSPLIFAFECKRYAPKNPVCVETARALLGTITHGDSRADRGVLVTTSRFTEPARKFIVTSPFLEGRDFNGIVEWIHELSGQMP